MDPNSGSSRQLTFIISSFFDSFRPVQSVATPVTDQYAKPVAVSGYLLSVFALLLVATAGERGRVEGRREVEVKQ